MDLLEILDGNLKRLLFELIVSSMCLTLLKKKYNDESG
jgi:hypothetical protein